MAGLLMGALVDYRGWSEWQLLGLMGGSYEDQWYPGKPAADAGLCICKLMSDLRPPREDWHMCGRSEGPVHLTVGITILSQAAPATSMGKILPNSFSFPAFNLNPH